MQISSDSIDEVLYPKIEAHSTGLLKVSELHTIHWEQNPEQETQMVFQLL